RGPAVARPVHVEAVERQDRGHQLDHRRIVVHDEDAPAHAPASRKRGNMIVTSRPWPGSERSEIFPPFLSSRSFVTPRPIPRPGTPDADADGLRQANVNACSCSSGVIPAPVSLIMTNACCATTLALTRTCPPAGVYLTALSSTLRNARWSATGSAATGISAPSATNSRRTLSPWASRYDSTRVERTRTRSERGPGGAAGAAGGGTGGGGGGARGGMPTSDSMSVISRAKPARCASEGSSPRRAASATRSPYTRRTVSGDFRSCRISLRGSPTAAGLAGALSTASRTG